jgi:pyruvate kinase
MEITNETKRLLGIYESLTKEDLFSSMSSVLCITNESRYQANNISKNIFHRQGTKHNRVVGSDTIGLTKSYETDSVDAVATMSEIITTVEKNPEFRRYIKLNWETIEGETLRDNAIAASSASLAYRLQAKALAVGTVTGKTAGLISSFRPDCLIVAMANDETVCRQLSLWWGVHAEQVNATAKTKNFAKLMKETLLSQELAEEGDRAVLVWGAQIGVSGTTESIRVVEL